MTSRRTGDFILIFTVAVLVIFGIIMVFSASYYNALSTKGDAYYYLKRVIMWAILGTAAMVVTSRVNYKIYRPWALIILCVSGALLVLIFTPLGVEINEARRWLGVGGFTIMPGEIAKPCTAIFAASFLSKQPYIIKSLKKGVAPLMGVMILFAGLIMIQPNMSTAMTLCGIMLCIMIAAGMPLRYLAGLGGIGGAAVVILMVIEPYRLARVVSFLDPFADATGTGFQAVQSLLALGSGGLTGLGIGKSIQKTLYLPEPMNDFIFSIIGEELGYIGCLLLLALYIIFIWRGVHIALHARDMFGMLLATGLTSMVAIQVVLNIAVVTSSMPPTGVALPFVSWGGNTLVIMMASAGILVNISKYGVKQYDNEEVKNSESDNDMRGNRRSHISGSFNRRQNKRK